LISNSSDVEVIENERLSESASEAATVPTAVPTPTSSEIVNV